MNISLIAAMTNNRVIGINNTISWILSNDRVWFKKNTINKPIIMGRITYESIGKPLSKRLNIVLSNTYKKQNEKIICVNSIYQALSAAGHAKEIMIIGGGQIYKLFLPKANRMYLTYIEADFIGDTYFPLFIDNEWNIIFNEYHKSDNKNTYDYCFKILERR